MWVLKIKGESHYVSHVTVEPGIGLCTKNTPDNPHTKGALKLKGKVKIFDNEAGEREAIIF